MRTFLFDGRSRWSPFRCIGGAMTFLIAALLLCAPTFAQYIGNDELFLAPLDVPTQVYDGIPLAAGDSFTFSTGSVTGATQLLSVHVLPLLNPNPATVEGEYSERDLANVSLGNYSSYYYRQPNVDYSATIITNDTTTVTFSQEGQYYVQLVTSDGNAVTNTVFRADVDDYLLEIPSLGLRDATGAGRVLPCPNSDLIVISDVPRQDAAIDQAKKQLPGAKKAANIAALKQALINKFNANGKKKFSLTIIAHGAPGQVEIGNQIMGQPGAMSAADFQKMIDPYVKSVRFFSCSVGAGAKGDKFGKDLGASIIGGVTLYDTPVTVAGKIWDIDARGKAKNFEFVVPEPSSTATAFVLFASLGLTLLRARRRV